MRCRRGFTMIEVLIGMSILMVLTALVYPRVTVMSDDVPAATMRATVVQVRRQISYHGFLDDVPLSNEGFPNDIKPSWFRCGALPHDAWVLQPLKIQVVHGPKNATEPNKKTFKVSSGKATGHTAWYNAANGSFVALVPDQGSEDDILELFDYVNGKD